MKDNFIQLWYHITSNSKKKFLILIFLILLTSLFEVATIGSVIPVLTIFTNPDLIFDFSYIRDLSKNSEIFNSKNLKIILLFNFSIIVILACVIRSFLTWYQANLTMIIVNELGSKSYKNILNQDYSKHILQDSKEVLAGVTVKIGTAVSGSISSFLNIISSIAITLSIFVALTFIEPYITISTIFIFSIMYLFTARRYKHSLEKNSQRINSSVETIIGFIQESLSNIKDIILNNNHKIFLNLFRDQDLILRKSQAHIQVTSFIPKYLIETIAILIIVMIGFVLSSKDGTLIKYIPIIGAFCLGAQKLLPIIHQIFSSWANITGYENLLRDALKILNIKNKSLEQKTNSKLCFLDNIKLSNVSFSYKNESNLILEKINLKIKKGEKIGIVGQTGSGKSTLCDIIMGLLEPTKGNLSVDGLAITNKNRKNWFSKISHVPQISFLTNSTIYENVAFGIPYFNIDKKKVREICELANVSEFVKSKNNNYDMLLGEGGVNLSGGQRQRISIARALFKNAELLIFDEATSSLDINTEKIVLDTIYNLNKNITLIIISHKFSNLKKCDVIYEIHKKKIKKIS